MKKLTGLLLIAISLLSCVGITYAAHYTGVRFWNLKLEEGDTFENFEDISETTYNGEPRYVRYYVPMFENGEPNNCKFQLIQSDLYKKDKTYTVPTIDEDEYLWFNMIRSWIYNCEYPNIYSYGYNEGNGLNWYQVVDRDDINLFAIAKLNVKLECDKDAIEKDEKSKCEIKLNSGAYVNKVEMILDTANLEIEDVVLNHKDFTYDEESGKISYKFQYDYNGIRFNKETVVSFTIAGEKQTKNELLSSSTTTVKKEKKFSLKLKDIIYTGEVTEDYKLNDVEKELTLITEEEVPVTTTTTKPTSTKPGEKEEVENPKTGVEDHLVILSLVITATGIILYQLKDKNIFREI